MKLILHILLSLTLSLFFSAFTSAEPINEVRDMDADGNVRIDILSGSVVIRSWDRNEFHIEGEVSNKADGYRLISRQGDIIFEEEYSRNSGFTCWFNNCSNRNRDNSSYTIMIPAGSDLRLEGLTAKLDIANLENGADIQSVNGDIIADNISGDIDIKTVNGDIDTSRLNGRLSLETINGDINDRQSSSPRTNFSTVNGDIDSTIASPRIQAETVNGDIELQPGATDELTASTVNGDIDIILQLSEYAEVELATVGGDVTLGLPASSSSEFELRTSGSIRNELSNDSAQSRSRYSATKNLEFTLVGGDANVEINSTRGDISLELMR